ncbi:hypothetical protein C2G38_2256762 [Gigaspora rosea]|uniref:Uncharacterized protein n=1 Tax=Gigaspora rosea TaxID=44941 RepID=A0A397TSA4_9GLOM|nr:hypothetical protein C2G38_2256762 [Gigaspora rosea]
MNSLPLESLLKFGTRTHDLAINTNSYTVNNNNSLINSILHFTSPANPNLDNYSTTSSVLPSYSNLKRDVSFSNITTVNSQTSGRRYNSEPIISFNAHDSTNSNFTSIFVPHGKATQKQVTELHDYDSLKCKRSSSSVYRSRVESEEERALASALRDNETLTSERI